jgi:hypothetical protein
MRTPIRSLAMSGRAADGEIKQLLAFVNRTNDFGEFGAIYRAAQPLECMPKTSVV